MNDVVEPLTEDNADTQRADERGLAAAEEPRHGVSSARSAGRGAMIHLRRNARIVTQAAIDKSRLAARATHHYVHASPWISVVLAATVTAAAAYLLGRRSR